MIKVYTGGTYDLFHRGHVNFLRQSRGFGEVWVSLNTDDFVKEFKGKKPIMTFEERRAVLESCRYVSQVIKNVGGKDSKLAIEVVMPNIITIGSDWKDKDYFKQMGFTRKWLGDRKISLVYLPYTEGISATEIKKRI